ncbi:DUF4828 domain-containing protein [Enterococcus hirae]|nr:DUF4828 domain-containing protein [Enterococcus hirae]
MTASKKKRFSRPLFEPVPAAEVSTHKRPKAPSRSFPTSFFGRYRFEEKAIGRTHLLEIKPPDLILVNQQVCVKRLLELTPQEIIFLDSFGYLVALKAENGRLLSMYDEANDVTYSLTKLSDIRKEKTPPIY